MVLQAGVRDEYELTSQPRSDLRDLHWPNGADELALIARVWKTLLVESELQQRGYFLTEVCSSAISTYEDHHGPLVVASLMLCGGRLHDRLSRAQLSNWLSPSKEGNNPLLVVILDTIPTLPVLADAKAVHVPRPQLNSMQCGTRNELKPLIDSAAKHKDADENAGDKAEKFLKLQASDVIAACGLSLDDALTECWKESS